jgi:hypothetical protein
MNIRILKDKAIRIIYFRESFWKLALMEDKEYSLKYDNEHLLKI